eukprot:Gb_04432 [translate_table: standard]
MGSPAELTLDCRPSASAYSSVLKAVSVMGDQLERMKRLDEYLKGLEEERRKIEAFKRELPFCMHLLNDAIAASKEQLADYQPAVQGTGPLRVGFSYEEEQYVPTSKDRPVLEEFIPIKKNCDESGDEFEGNNHRDSKRTRFANGEKPNWMSSAQLWSQNSYTVESPKEKTSSIEESLKQQDSHFKTTHEQGFPTNSKLFLDSKQRTGGAFLPFSRERQGNPSLSARSNAGKALPDLALSSGEQEVGSSFRGNETASLNNATTNSKSRSKETTETAAPVPPKEGVARPNGGVSMPSTPAITNAPQSSSQSQRKARRCWSPELHRRFVNALQQLGGSQATPKQIRELMKVDGLTNDEVKSHLQKYRLHTRRPSPTPQTSTTQAPQLVVLGGIWVPPEYAAHAAAAAHQAPGLYSPLSTTTTTHSQSHYCQSSIPQEYYSQMNRSSQTQQPGTIYCEQQQTPSQSLSSPQGPLQFPGQSSGARGTSPDGGREESVGEDGKSESSSWKGEENTENGDVRTMGGVLSLRKQPLQSVDGDEEDSRGSETTLKF